LQKDEQVFLYFSKKLSGQSQSFEQTNFLLKTPEENVKLLIKDEKLEEAEQICSRFKFDRQK